MCTQNKDGEARRRPEPRIPFREGIEEKSLCLGFVYTKEEKLRRKCCGIGRGRVSASI